MNQVTKLDYYIEYYKIDQLKRKNIIKNGYFKYTKRINNL